MFQWFDHGRVHSVEGTIVNGTIVREITWAGQKDLSLATCELLAEIVEKGLPDATVTLVPTPSGINARIDDAGVIRNLQMYSLAIAYLGASEGNRERAVLEAVNSTPGTPQ